MSEQTKPIDLGELRRACEDKRITSPQTVLALVRVVEAALVAQSAPGPNEELDALDKLAEALTPFRRGEGG